MIQDDQEPERYYDWMIWKSRQERKKLQGVKKDGV
jgi:hypothetical protein